jgi:fucose permease
VFYLPLFLQNAYGFQPATAGLAMLPFALPMVLTPHWTAKLANRVSGRLVLTIGLAVTAFGNFLFWLVAHSALPYSIFVVGMLVAGTGAGLLNGETVKVLGGAVPAARAGMASGLASTTRFLGILFGVAGLGAVLSYVTRSSFTAEAIKGGLDATSSASAARQVTSGNLTELLKSLPSAVREQLHLAGQNAFAHGFGAAALLAVVVASVACILTFVYVRTEDTEPGTKLDPKEQPCMTVDCRHPI